jgi:hypothetical protein
MVVDKMSVTVGRNSIVFVPAGPPSVEAPFTFPCTRVKPGGTELVLRIVFGKAVSAKPVPNTTTATNNTTMTSLYPV